MHQTIRKQIFDWIFAQEDLYKCQIYHLERKGKSLFVTSTFPWKLMRKFQKTNNDILCIRFENIRQCVAYCSSTDEKQEIENAKQMLHEAYGINYMGPVYLTVSKEDMLSKFK